MSKSSMPRPGFLIEALSEFVERLRQCRRDAVGGDGRRGRRGPMNTAFVAGLTILCLCEPIQAADKILKIGFPVLAAQFVPLPLGEKRGLFKEEGGQGGVIC